MAAGAEGSEGGEDGKRVETRRQNEGDIAVKNLPDETLLFDPGYGSHGWVEHIW